MKSTYEMEIKNSNSIDQGVLTVNNSKMFLHQVTPVHHFARYVFWFEFFSEIFRSENIYCQLFTEIAESN